MDPPKAFDCIPPDLLIQKLHAYSFSIESPKLFYSYSKEKTKYKD